VTATLMATELPIKAWLRVGEMKDRVGARTRARRAGVMLR